MKSRRASRERKFRFGSYWLKKSFRSTFLDNYNSYGLVEARSEVKMARIISNCTDFALGYDKSSMNFSTNFARSRFSNLVISVKALISFIKSQFEEVVDKSWNSVGMVTKNSLGFRFKSLNMVVTAAIWTLTSGSYKRSAKYGTNFSPASSQCRISL